MPGGTIIQQKNRETFVRPALIPKLPVVLPANLHKTVTYHSIIRPIRSERCEHDPARNPRRSVASDTFPYFNRFFLPFSTTSKFDRAPRKQRETRKSGGRLRQTKRRRPFPATPLIESHICSGPVLALLPPLSPYIPRFFPLLSSGARAFSARLSGPDGSRTRRLEVAGARPCRDTIIAAGIEAFGIPSDGREDWSGIIP